MPDKKIPMRMCVSCREMKPKKELIRFVKNDSGIYLDYTGKVNGRGAYVCNNADCIKKCLKTRALNRVYGQEIPQEVYDKLLEEFVEKNS